jgi:tRNA-splicing ligase RtcB
MQIKTLEKVSPYEWLIEATGPMRVPVVIFADEQLVSSMDEKVRQQASNVAALPGIVKASYVMPDAHWGYGFCIGGVAAFDAGQGGIISAGGVGFDISCGVRTLTTGLTVDDLDPARKKILADLLAHKIPAGVGSTGHVRLNHDELDEMLVGGAQWAIEQGYGMRADLMRIEEQGAAKGAMPKYVSDEAHRRQRDETGTLGSGNHYLEVQEVREIFDPQTAAAFGIAQGDLVVSIHCGSRGLGHQIGTDYLRKMVISAREMGVELPERELACAPVRSEVGQQYLGAMRAGINCALANRQILTHLVRQALPALSPKADVRVLYDVSHNTCKQEVHQVGSIRKEVYVHRKGATRSFGPGDPMLDPALKSVGQPVLIGGTMGTASYILAGTAESLTRAFGSSCHGAGRAMSRHQATQQFHGRSLVRSLEERGILVRSPSMRGVAEEAPEAYKDVDAVTDAAHNAGLSTKVAKLRPMIVVKG